MAKCERRMKYVIEQNVQGSPQQASSSNGSNNHLRAKVSLPSTIQDSDYEEDDNEDINGDISMTKAKGRGPSKAWEEWGKGEKIMLEWDEKGNPVGQYAAQLGTQVRSYGRNGNMFPFYYVRWDKRFWKTALEQIWKEVQANTNAPERFKKLCFARIAASWKSFKIRLKKKYYDKYKTDKERLSHKPNEVLKEQWAELVAYWGSDTYKAISDRNIINRGLLFAYSKTGRTAHASIKAERIKRNLPVDNLSMWLVTRNKDGVYDSIDGAANREAAIKRKLAELSEEDQENPIEREKIFREIVGEDGHGYVLLGGVGVQPSPKKMQFSSLPTTSSLDNDARIASLESKLEEQQSQHREEVRYLLDQITSYAVEIIDLRKDFVELEQRYKENISIVAREIEWRILNRLQHEGAFVSNLRQYPNGNGSHDGAFVSNLRQYSNGNGSTSRRNGYDENISSC